MLRDSFHAQSALNGRIAPVQTGDGECHAIYDTPKCLPEIPRGAISLRARPRRVRLSNRSSTIAPGECGIGIRPGNHCPRRDHCHRLLFEQSRSLEVSKSRSYATVLRSFFLVLRPLVTWMCSNLVSRWKSR